MRITMDFNEIKVGDILRYYCEQGKSIEHTVELVIKETTTDKEWLGKFYETITLAVLEKNKWIKVGDTGIISSKTSEFYSRDLRPEKLFEKNLIKILDK